MHVHIFLTETVHMAQWDKGYDDDDVYISF